MKSTVVAPVSVLLLSNHKGHYKSGMLRLNGLEAKMT